MAEIIAFKNVSKRFVLTRDKVRSWQDIFVRLLQRRNAPAEKYSRDFWALKDISFSINEGETVGLVGANGAGKSTALKLITQIIQPSTGSVQVRGRVTALLELGAGFQPELTGRDNIFLYGAVMGLTQRELRKRADAIIEFAEMEEFIDVPVKTYSSGMQARLGFAVSVHLDPKVLLVDEVLAVGDQSFQQKCYEHMQKMRRKGITLLFVSHSLESVTDVCARAIWLEHGKMIMDDRSTNVTAAYYRRVLEEDTRQHAVHDAAGGADTRRYGTGEVTLSRVEFLDEHLQPRSTFVTGEPMVVRLHYEANVPVHDPVFGIAVYRSDSGVQLTGPNSMFDGCTLPTIHGVGCVDYRVDRVPWLPGEFDLHAAIVNREDSLMYDYWFECARFVVAPGGTRDRAGVMALGGQWQVG